MIARLINTSLMVNWWIDWKTNNKTTREASKLETISTCFLLALTLRLSNSLVDTNTIANSQRNGSMRSGSGILSGSVSIKKSGPETYTKDNTAILVIFCLLFSLSILWVYEAKEGKWSLLLFSHCNITNKVIQELFSSALSTLAMCSVAPEC